MSRITYEEIQEEVSNGGDYQYFAYPGGHSSKEAVREIKKHFKAAFSIKPGLVQKGDDVFKIKRNVVLQGMRLWEFKVRVTKAIHWYTSVVNFLKKI